MCLLFSTSTANLHFSIPCLPDLRCLWEYLYAPAETAPCDIAYAHHILKKHKRALWSLWRDCKLVTAVSSLKHMKNIVQLLLTVSDPKHTHTARREVWDFTKTCLVKIIRVSFFTAHWGWISVSIVILCKWQFASTMWTLFVYNLKTERSLFSRFPTFLQTRWHFLKSKFLRLRLSERL